MPNFGIFCIILFIIALAYETWGFCQKDDDK